MSGQPDAPGTYQLHGDGLMKIRKVPADWLDAPHTRGRTTAGPPRGSTNRGKRQPAQSAGDQRDSQKETGTER